MFAKTTDSQTHGNLAAAGVVMCSLFEISIALLILQEILYPDFLVHSSRQS